MYKILIESLSNTNISKMDYEDITKEINFYCDRIWRYICKASNRSLEWWAFQNDVSLGNGNGSTGGHFNIETDSEFIEIDGGYGQFVSEITIPNVGPKQETIVEELCNNPHYDYHSGFPTALLWDENWQETVDKHISNSIQKLTAARIAKYAKNEQKKVAKKVKVKSHKERLESILTKIQSVLTEEDFQFLRSKLVY